MNLSSRSRRCLALMGIDVWVRRDAGEVQATESAPARTSGPAIEPAPRAVPVRGDMGIPAARGDVPPPAARDGDWEALRAEVAACRRCGLHATRTQTVFGVGNTAAEWMLIGEAPGAEEDRQGEPFVGRAGQLLNNMLAAMGLAREQVYICNILRCRPPKNRDPLPEEADACAPFLKKQIAWVRPRIILALGRVAAQNLLRVETPIGRMRGQRYEYPDPRVPLVVTYHPAYLLRSPREKRKVWEDLCFAMQVYRESQQ